MTRPQMSTRRTLDPCVARAQSRSRVAVLAGKQDRTPPIEFLAGKRLGGVAMQLLTGKELGNSKSFGEWKLRTIEQQIGPNVSYCFGRRDERLRARHQSVTRWMSGFASHSRG